MQLELQNIGRPAAAALVLGRLLTPGVGTNQALSHLRAEFQQSQYPSQTSSTAYIPKLVNIDHTFKADIFLLGLVENTATQKKVFYSSFSGLFPQGISFLPIRQKSINENRKSP